MQRGLAAGGAGRLLDPFVVRSRTKRQDMGRTGLFLGQDRTRMRNEDRSSFRGF